MPRFLPLPLVGYGVSLIFTASLRSSKNGSLAITSFKNDRQVFNTTLVETVFPFLLILAPSDGYRRHRPRRAGTAYDLHSFFLIQQ